MHQIARAYGYILLFLPLSARQLPCVHPFPLSFLGSASEKPTRKHPGRSSPAQKDEATFTRWHSTFTAVLGALNIIKLWPAIITRFCRRIWTLKPSTKFEHSLHPQGRQGLGQLAPCPQAHVGDVTRRIPHAQTATTRQPMGKGGGWAGSRLGTTLACLRPLHIRGELSPPFARRVHASIATKPHPSSYTLLGRTPRVWSLHCVPSQPLHCIYCVAIVDMSLRRPLGYGRLGHASLPRPCVTVRISSRGTHRHFVAPGMRHTM
ncbi:hypothetical protein B0H19DRAFT_1242467 [Mycena capillaripes]|nr:hypothetical protein B0H19DRAFT_1242467 [Mycena capillaripes]